MSYSKVGELVEILYLKTKKGELGWEDTEFDNMFLTSSQIINPINQSR